MMKHANLLYVHDASIIYKFPASQDIRISMRCLRHERVDHTRFPAWISRNPGSTWIIQIQYVVWQDPPTFANHSASMIQFYA